MHESTNKIVYVLTSDGQDVYANMNLFSICSFLKSNPDVCVKLLCEERGAKEDWEFTRL